MKRYLDVTAHELIAQVALELAQEIYEETMSGNNALYKVNVSREDFLKQCAPTLKSSAKVLLGALLNDPTVGHWEKERIYEALVLDNMLPKTGVSIAPNSWRQ